MVGLNLVGGADPLLCLSFVGGFVVGRLVRRRSPWISYATLGTVVLIVTLFGASLASEPVVRLLETIPAALLLVAVIGIATVGVAVGLLRATRRGAGLPPLTPTPAGRISLPPLLIGALAGGYVLGRFVALPTSTVIPWVLYAMVALVAFGLELHLADLKTLWIPLVAAPVGATVGAIVIVLWLGLSAPVALATTFGMAWYSLAGPLVAARAGAVVGLLAFLVNFWYGGFEVRSESSGSLRFTRGEGCAGTSGGFVLERKQAPRAPRVYAD